MCADPIGGRIWGNDPSGRRDATDLLRLVEARAGPRDGAMLQRRVHESTGDLAAVVRNAVSHTLSVE